MITSAETDNEPDERTSLLPGSKKNGYLSSSSYQNQQKIYLNQVLQTALNDRRSAFQQNVSFRITLLVYTLERFAFYGLICNYILYLNKQPLDWKSFNASLILLIFFGVLNITSVIGGWVADSFLGKYTTICLSFVGYIVGYAAFPYLSFYNKIPDVCYSNSSRSNWSRIDEDFPFFVKPDRPLIQETCSWIIILTVVVIGLSVGFIRANLGPFGADQVTSRGQTMVFKYFNWLYWSINLGSLLAYSVLAYIQQNKSFFLGFTIPFFSLVLSFVLFLIGSFSYIKNDAEKSVITKVIRIIQEAFRSVKRQKNFIKQKERERKMLSESEDEQERFDTYSTENEEDDSGTSYKTISFLDNAKIRFGGRFADSDVDDVKSLKRILLLFALLIPYWILYFQIETSYIIQGLHMKLFSRSETIGIPAFMIPAAWLSIADNVTVLFMIPLMDSLVYPFMRRRFKNLSIESTRLVFGMSLSALSVISAGILESVRHNLITEDPQANTVVQIIDNTSYVAANLNILWQIPQYTLTGLGEVFCSVTCLYYAYSEAPKSMQSMIMGLFYFFSGAGSLAGSAILVLFKKIIYTNSKNIDDINCSSCRFNYYFYSLALVQMAGIGIFILVDCKFVLVRCKYDGNRRERRESSGADFDQREFSAFEDELNLNKSQNEIEPIDS
ncbi:Solute carrier family 15 member 4 [Brachionus plicatilis]|uniref:Solute carrier family 15 member 4 n=1 Tax=Brachionus plicatilis TaxID=10195 RepID=A0A3M7SSZ3_BRAPC|nr:Solute carrier family 15 member 4 [Brachionus plicatilis]